jgi:hypothetical protein
MKLVARGEDRANAKPTLLITCKNPQVNSGSSERDAWLEVLKRMRDVLQLEPLGETTKTTLRYSPRRRQNNTRAEGFSFLWTVHSIVQCLWEIVLASWELMPQLHLVALVFLLSRMAPESESGSPTFMFSLVTKILLSRSQSSFMEKKYLTLLPLRVFTYSPHRKKT